MKLHRVFFFLTLIFLPTQLGLHFWPDWSMVFGRRVDYLSPTLFFTDILIGLTIVSWVVGKILKTKYQISRIQMCKKYIAILMCCVLFIGVNILFATNRFVALYKWGKVFEFVLFGLYTIKTKPRLSSIIFFLSLAVFYSSIIAIIQFFLQHSIGGPLWLFGERTFSVDTPGIARNSFCFFPFLPAQAVASCRLLLRSYATFPHPNVLGGFLATLLPIIMVQLSTSRRHEKIFFIFSLVVGLAALALTFSRSAWVVSGVAFVTIFLFHLKRSWVSLSLIVLVVASALVVFLSSAGSLTTESESVVVRQELSVAALTLWRQSPLFGVGLGNFLVRLPDVTNFRQVYFLQPVHNIYLLVLSETGVIGLMIFTCLLMIVLRNARFPARMSIISLLLLGLVDHYPLTLQQGQLLLTIFFSLSLF